MKFVNEFRDADKAQAIAARINAEVQQRRQYHFMEFCGGHTYTIFRFGIDGVLPKQIRMVHGPGCPVCVLPIGRLDMAIQLVRERNVILCSYGDMLRVPGSNRTSLLHVKAEGADVRMIYSNSLVTVN